MKKVFEYMEECIDTEERMSNYYKNLDGNLMVLTIQKMNEKGDFGNFLLFIAENTNGYFSNCFIEKEGICLCERDCTLFYGYRFIFWLFGNPDNFFKLMEEWLNEKAD